MTIKYPTDIEGKEMLDYLDQYPAIVKVILSIFTVILLAFWIGAILPFHLIFLAGRSRC